MREAYGEEFEGAELFLDSATYGLPSRRQAEALRNELRKWELGELVPPDFDEPVAAARTAFAALAGVEVASVACGGSVSALLGLVAAGMPEGASVAVMEGEFTSVTGPFAAQADRGVTIETLPRGVFEAAAGGFDVVAVSMVQSSDGYVLDVSSLRAATAGARTSIVLDVTQALGWMHPDASFADVVVGGSYKWLLSPRGAAWMSIAPHLAHDLVPHTANWYSSETPWQNTYASPLLLAETARRFDASPAWFTHVGAGIAMPWLASLDAAEVERHCVGLANAAREGLGLPASASAILSVSSPDAAERLASAGIRCAVRAGRARVGFHLYNTEDDVARLVGALRE